MITIFVSHTLAYADDSGFILAFGMKSSDTPQSLSKVIELEKNQHNDDAKFDVSASSSAPYSYDINIYVYGYFFNKQGNICTVFGMGEIDDKKIKSILIKEYGQPVAKKEKLEWQLKDNVDLKSIEVIYYKDKGPAIALAFHFKRVDECGLLK